MSVNSSRIKIHIFIKLPTPYNDTLLRVLHVHPAVDLQVHHLWHGTSRRPWKTDLGIGYPNRYMRTFLGIDWLFLKLCLREKASIFIIGDWGHVSSLALIVTRILIKSPIALWVDTPQEHIPRSIFKRWPRKKLLSWLLPKIDIVFATGKPAIEVVQAMGARPEAIVNLPYFVDLDIPILARSHPQTLELARRYRKSIHCEEQGIVFSMLGRLADNKGFDIGLRSFAKCKANIQTPMGMLIAGEGPERQALENLARTLGISECVNFLGWLEPSQTDAVYVGADVVIHPARYDPYPLVVLESMAWGKVVVGSDACGSIVDRVQSGVNGYSFHTGDETALTTIITGLIARPEHCASLGQAARNTAEDWPPERGVDIIVSAARRTLNLRAE